MAGMSGNIKGGLTAAQEAKINAIEAASGFNAKIERQSATVIRLSGKSFTNKLVTVNGEDIDLSTPLDCTVGGTPDDLLETGSPSANTQYYIYLTNTAGGGPYLRLSATVPTETSYRTGDGDSKLAGTVWLDASVEVAESWNLAGLFGDDVITNLLTSTESKTSGSGYYALTSLDTDKVVYLKNTILVAKAAITGNYLLPSSYSLERNLKLYQDAAEVANGFTATDLSEHWGTCNSTAFETFKTAAGENDFSITVMYGGAGTWRVFGSATVHYSYIQIIRRHKG